MAETVPQPMPEVRDELRRLRGGSALAHPGVVRTLSPALQAHLLAQQGTLTGTSDEVLRMVAALRRAIDALASAERLYAQTDFNLLAEHNWPTLGERQESLARVLGCTAKTVRRRSSQALDTLALLIVTAAYPAPQREKPETNERTAYDRRVDDLRRFWKITDSARIDVVCSQIPHPYGPTATSPADPYYARYGHFADLDALMYVRVRLARMFPTADIRDFYPGEYYDADADILIVIGAPARNTKYQEFEPHLPYRFGPHPDEELTFPGITNEKFGPCRAGPRELLSDISLITRLTLTQGTTVFLLGGPLALGAFGAAKCFLHAERGPRNAAWLNDLVDDDDVVLVTETRRIGGITDTADLTATAPLFVMARNGTEPFTPVHAGSSADSLQGSHHDGSAINGH